MKLGTLVSALSAFPSEGRRHRPGPRNPATPATGTTTARSGSRRWWRAW